MKKLILKSCAVIGLAVCVSITNATNYYVSNSGSDSNNGLTLGNAFLTIQHATDLVVAGDSILIADGNYAGFNHQSLNSGTPGNPIVYKAIGNNAKINTKGPHAKNAINVENNDYIHIIGIKCKNMIQYGIVWNTFGVRMVASDHSEIRNMECDSNGIGIFTGYCEYLTIENNKCRYNKLQHGIYHSNNGDYAIVRYNYCAFNAASGIQFNPDKSEQQELNDGAASNCVVSYNICHDNNVGINTQGMYNSIISNNLIYNNNNHGISFYQDDHGAPYGWTRGVKNTKLFNNTIIADTKGRNTVYMRDSLEDFYIYNNILINTGTKAGGSFAYDQSINGWKYISNMISNYNILCDKFCDNSDNCFGSQDFTYWKSLGYDANSISVGNTISGLFVDAANNDYHLVITSAAVDNGTNLVSGSVTKDLDGMIRPAGGTFDAGCYEYGSTPAGFIENMYNSKITIVRVADNIVFMNIEPTDVVEVYNLRGQKVNQNDGILNTSNFSDGVYLYVVRSLNNYNKIQSGKLLIQK